MAQWCFGRFIHLLCGVLCFLWGLKVGSELATQSSYGVVEWSLVRGADVRLLRGYLVSCSACWVLDFWFVVVLFSSFMVCLRWRSFRKQVSHVCPLIWGRGPFTQSFCRAILVSMLIRVGEASHPGPSNVQSEWTMGIFNPSGLRNKIDALAFLPGDIWMGSETHLTRDGFRSLQRGLRALGSPYRYAVPGAFCPSRTVGGAGTHQGVLSIARVPTRSLPHAIPEDLYSTARVQVIGFAVGRMWIQAGVLYGYPDSPQYCNRTFQTNALLEQLVWRIGQQADGPRIICGDFNHEASQLSAISQLRALGFQEIQTIARDRWGHCPIPTGRGAVAIDQVWLSPEMQALLCGFEVYHDHWADHVSLQGRFQYDTFAVAFV